MKSFYQIIVYLLRLKLLQELTVVHVILLMVETSLEVVDTEGPLIFPVNKPEGPNNNSNFNNSNSSKKKQSSTDKKKKPGWLSKSRFNYLSKTALQAVKNDATVDLLEFAKTLYQIKYKSELNEDSLRRIVNFVQRNSGYVSETQKIQTNLGIVG